MQTPCLINIRAYTLLGLSITSAVC